MDSTEQWGWDLLKNKPVRWSDRGLSDQVLGPYPSRDAALRWRELVEERNIVWDEHDEAWKDGEEKGQ